MLIASDLAATNLQTPEEALAQARGEAESASQEASEEVPGAPRAVPQAPSAPAAPAAPAPGPVPPAIPPTTPSAHNGRQNTDPQSYGYSPSTDPYGEQGGRPQ